MGRNSSAFLVITENDVSFLDEKASVVLISCPCNPMDDG